MSGTSGIAASAPRTDETFTDGRTLTFHERERAKEADARRRIAFVLVGAYVVLLALTVLAPIVSVKLVGSTNDDVAALKAASESVASILTGVAGVLGFVLGYYFKSEEEKKP